MSTIATIAVILPVLHESERIGRVVAALQGLSGVRLVVVDGDPEGSTIAGLDLANGVCITAGPGRAAQMNAGAEVAMPWLAPGDILLFLHADTVLPEAGLEGVRQLISAGFARCGAFQLRFDAPGCFAVVTGWWAGFRSRLDRRPYGDQAQFFRADFFQELGGYAPIALMEDVEIMARAVALKRPPALLPCTVTTSARRYLREGWLRRGLKNMLLRIRFALGASPDRLAAGYREHGRRRRR